MNRKLEQPQTKTNEKPIKRKRDEHSIRRHEKTNEDNKNQWLNYNTIHNFCKLFKLDEKIIIKQKEPLLLTKIGTIVLTIFFVRITEKVLKEMTNK